MCDLYLCYAHLSLHSAMALCLFMNILRVNSFAKCRVVSTAAAAAALSEMSRLTRRTCIILTGYML